MYIKLYLKRDGVFMCVKTNILKTVMKSRDKNYCMMEILDILDKDKRNRNLRNAIVLSVAGFGVWYVYNLLCAPYAMEMPQDVEEHVMGFKPPIKKDTEEPAQED